MSAITVGCMQTYKGSVEKTLDEVDTNIKVLVLSFILNRPVTELKGIVALVI